MSISWLVGSGVLTLIAVFLTLWPLYRQRHMQAQTAIAYDIARYKSQLDEITRDPANGMASEIEAETARVEISRRLLKADKTVQQNETTLCQGKVPVVRLPLLPLSRLCFGFMEF